MAASNKRDLFLQVGGNVDNLAAASKAGKTVLLSLGTTADQVADEVRKAFDGMASNAPAAARQLEKSYSQTFATIRSNAKAALSAPNAGSALQIIDAGAAEQAAAAAEAQAAALRQVANAAAIVATRAGEAGAAERVLAVASEANAQQAMREAEALRTQATILGSVRGELQSMGVVHGVVTGRTEQQRQSTIMLGQQLQDFSVQVVSGQSVTTAFAQQIGQAAFAVQGLGGKFEGVAAFLTSGWGIAATVFLTVAAPLLSKVIDLGDAVGNETDKLKENAEKTTVAASAKEAFGKTEAGLIAGVRELTQEIEKQNEALKTNAERQNISAKEKLDGLLKDQAKVREDLAKARSSAGRNGAFGGFNGGSAMSMTDDGATKVRALETKLATVTKAVAEARAAVSATRADLADESAKRAIDPLEQIKRRYEGPDGLIEQAKKRAEAEGTVTTQLTRQLALLRQRERTELAREQKRQSDAKAAGRATTSRSDEAALGDMTALLKTVLPGVRITATTNGKHVPGSDHYKDRAIDFVPAGGMGSISKASMRELLVGAGVNIRRNAAGVEQFFGPGDKGHSNHFHVAWNGGVKSTDDLAKANQQRERAAEAAAQKRIRDDEAYGQLKNRAQQQLLDTFRGQVTSATQAADLDVQAVMLEKDRLVSAAQAGVAEKRWSQAKADELIQLYAGNAAFQAAAIRQRELVEVGQRKLDLERDDLEERNDLLRLQGDLATTAAERRRISLEILANEEKIARATLAQAIESERDPDRKAGLLADYVRLTPKFAAKRAGVERDNEGPLAAYKRQLADTTADTNTALEQIAVRGFGQIEDASASAIGGAVKNLLHLKGVAGDVVGSIIADLARLAVQKAFVKILGGFSEGGEVTAQSNAAGGYITGPGTGTSDDILSWLSNGEFVMNAAATRKYLPMLHAMNDNALPAFASGGFVGSLLGLPRIPSAAAISQQAQPMLIQLAVRKGEAFAAEVIGVSGPHSLQLIEATAPQIVETARDHTIAQLTQPRM